MASNLGRGSCISFMVTFQSSGAYRRFRAGGKRRARRGSLENWLRAQPLSFNSPGLSSGTPGVYEASE